MIKSFALLKKNPEKIAPLLRWRAEIQGNVGVLLSIREKIKRDFPSQSPKKPRERERILTDLIFSGKLVRNRTKRIDF